MIIYTIALVLIVSFVFFCLKGTKTNPKLVPETKPVEIKNEQLEEYKALGAKLEKLFQEKRNSKSRLNHFFLLKTLRFPF